MKSSNYDRAQYSIDSWEIVSHSQQSSRAQRSPSPFEARWFQEQEANPNKNLSPSPDVSRSSSPVPAFTLPLFTQVKAEAPPQLPPKEPVKLTTTQLVILVPIVVGIEFTKFAFNSARSMTSYITSGK